MNQTLAFTMPEEKNLDIFDIPLPSVHKFEVHIVRIDTQYHNEPTIMLRLEGLLDLCTYFVCEHDTDEDDVNSCGYLGKYKFREGVYHVICPALADPEIWDDSTSRI